MCSKRARYSASLAPCTPRVLQVPRRAWHAHELTKNVLTLCTSLRSSASNTPIVSSTSSVALPSRWLAVSSGTRAPDVAWLPLPLTLLCNHDLLLFDVARTGRWKISFFNRL